MIGEIQKETNDSHWRKCTTCKKGIGFNQKYWICSVSTCNRQRTGLVFCSVTCFDAHVPVLNHRDAGAFEKRAPSLAQYEAEKSAVSNAAPTSQETQKDYSGDVLVVVSKVKEYIKLKSGGMSTSDAVMDRLTKWVLRWCDASIQSAQANARTTVLDRDVPATAAPKGPTQVILRK